jgi:hypothetical protein
MRLWFCLAAAGLFACSSTTTTEPGDELPPVGPPVVESPEPPVASAEVPSGASRAAGARDLGLGTSPTPATFVCRAGAFCDDFESQQPVGTRWSQVFEGAGGKLESDSESASVGRGAVTLFAPTADSQIFLDRTSGGVAPKWSGLMGFALKVAAVPGSQLGGPELVVKTQDGPIAVRVSLRPEGLVLEQLAPECGRARCRPTAKLIAPAKEGAWYRVRIGFEVGAQAAPPYGRLEATVDDGPLVTTDLDVPLYDGSVSLHAGITQGDSRRALVNLDDVMLFTR